MLADASHIVLENAVKTYRYSYSNCMVRVSRTAKTNARLPDARRQAVQVPIIAFVVQKPSVKGSGVPAEWTAQSREQRTTQTQAGAYQGASAS